AWFFGALAPEARRGRGLLFFATASVALIVSEIAYSRGQSARGLGSHFNDTTPIEGLMFTLMGLAALVFTAFPAALGIAIARRPRVGLAPAFRLSLVLGLLLTAALGIATGTAIAVNGGHWVGAAPT